MRPRLVSVPVEPDTVDEVKPFWRQRRWQVSAGFLAFAILAGIVGMVTGADGSGSATSASGPVIGTLGADGTRPQGCRTDDSKQSIPTTAPQDITWRQLNGAGVPLSASAGPLKTTGPLLWCFAHTPMGAVMAADVIPRQMSGPDWRVVTQQQLVPGFPRDYFEAMRASIDDTGQVKSANSLAGFQVTRYTAKSATVQILIKQASITYLSIGYTVDWDGVDWKVRPLNTGGLYTDPALVSTLAGFVLWSEG